MSGHPQFGKIYFREIEPEGSLAKLARLVPAGATVLDLGAGPGVLGRALRQNKACVVDGVEGNPEAAAHARPFYRTLAVLDLERDRLPELFAGRRYDAIICADILEHLRDPSFVLTQLPPLLSPAGRILVSLPNIGYAGVVAELIGGDFRYRPDGVLDRTHVRFFTRRSLTEWLAQHELAIMAEDSVRRDLRASEFELDAFERLPPAMLRVLLRHPDALTYQFVVAVAPRSQAVEPAGVADADAAEVPSRPQFDAKLYYRGPGEPFDEQRSIGATGEIGVERQTLRFVVPPALGPIECLRLDPGDRQGYLRLYRMVLRDSVGGEVWRWQGALAELERMPMQQLVIAAAPKGEAGACALIMGDDPAIELPLGPTNLGRLAEGGELEVFCSWPMSSDYRALLEHLRPPPGVLTRIASAIERRLATFFTR